MNFTRLIELSDRIHAAKSIEELNRIRDDIRPEVKQMSWIDQDWLVCEVESATFRILNPGISDEDLDKILKKLAKDEVPRKSVSRKRKPSKNRSGHRKTPTKYADNYYGWPGKK